MPCSTLRYHTPSAANTLRQPTAERRQVTVMLYGRRRAHRLANYEASIDFVALSVALTNASCAAPGD